MKQFQDNASPPNTRTVELTYGSARAVRDATGVDLLQPGRARHGQAEPVWTELSNDIILLIDVLYVLCGRTGETDERFARAMGPPEGRPDDPGPVDAGYAALTEELASFFDRLHRPMQSAFVRKTAAMLGAIEKRGAEALESLDPETIATGRAASMTALLKATTPAEELAAIAGTRTPGPSAGSSPPASEPPPTPSPGTT